MKKILFLPLLVLLVTCADRVEQTHQRVTIQLSQKQEAASPTDEFGYTDPASINDYDCLGLFIDYPEISSQNFCFNNSGNTIAEFNEWFGLSPVAISNNTLQSGGQITANVLIGQARRFYVIGFNIDTAQISCPSILDDWDSIEQYMSEPDLLNPGGAAFDVFAGSSSASINISYANHIDFDDCEGPLFDLDEEEFDFPQDGMTGWYKADNIDGSDNTSISYGTPLADNTNWFNSVSGAPPILLRGNVTPNSSGNLGSLPQLSFDGSADYSTLNHGGNTKTIFIAFYPTSDAGVRILDGVANNAWNSVTIQSTDLLNWNSQTTPLVINQTIILRLESGGSGVGEFYVNGVQGSQVTSLFNDIQTPTAFFGTSGGAELLPSDVGEILIFETLDTAVNNQVECYLGNKYGVTISGC